MAFESAVALVPDDTNGDPDVFVYDRQTNTIERVSVSSTGAQGSGGFGIGATAPSISSDGRFVAFQADFDNLVTGDGNGLSDVFVYDRDSDTIERVSISSSSAARPSPSRTTPPTPTSFSSPPSPLRMSPSR